MTRKRSPSKRVPTSFRFSRQTIQQLAACAAHVRMSRAQTIERLIESMFRNLATESKTIEAKHE